MQSATGKRVLSTLASKLHPQLPLSPRESQQLLSLLTSSFRAHLDREHPLGASESSQERATLRPSLSNGQRGPSPMGAAASSYASATQHIDSILNNPLFAVKPRRRGSESAAMDVLRDPLTWFVNEIAAGSATLSKAAMCLEMLDKTPNQDASRAQNQTRLAMALDSWLRSSGLENSKQFMELCVAKSGHGSRFLERLVALLRAQVETDAPWRWFIRPNEQRVKETGLDIAKVVTFRQQVLLKMVSTVPNAEFKKSMVVFMCAFRNMENAGYESAYSVLRSAGGSLVNRITANTDLALTVDVELYQSFLSSSQRWLRDWSRAVEAMLWLYHPSRPNTRPGLLFIQDPTGALAYVKSTPSRKNFLVQLCLAVSQQLIHEKKFAEARAVMAFTREHFADMVLPKPAVTEQLQQHASAPRKERKERANLELLDSLVPT
ncbi:Proteasome subunit beta type-1 [Pyrenophora seminiperda CCB06]|uniref:Proteasome subunit beta type-1 n=1 Tax=Pyrenophora seminiperda CCB06 TaxID=1302712 RepID=A0A3M7MBN0_9PLEO|nr:Proteasome subunit beta type-1 [Pyrenophora seminiperda CCB06]